MRLISIYLQSFRLHAETQIDFPEGVVGLIGSNESGKSTILEGIEWALFGGSVTRGTLDGIRWNRAPARKLATVTLSFEIGGKVYEVKRTETNATLKEGEKVIAQGTAPVNKFIPKLIGMGPDEFRSSFLCRQKDVARIATMLPTERQAFIREVMGVGKIDTGLKACRKQKSALSAEMSGLEAGLGLRAPLEEALEEAQGECVAADKNWIAKGEDHKTAAITEARAKKDYEASERRRLVHTQLETERDQALRDQGRAIKEAERLQNKMVVQAQAKPRVEEADDKLKVLPEHRKARDELLDAKNRANERATLLNDVDEANQKIDELQASTAKYKETVIDFTQQEYDEALAKAEKADEALTALRDARAASGARKRFAAEQAERESKAFADKAAFLQQHGPDSDCPTCTRPLGDQFNSVVAALLDQAFQAEKGAEDCRIDVASFEDPSDDEINAELDKDEAEEKLEWEKGAKAKAATATDLLAVAQAQLTDLLDDRDRRQKRADEIGDVEQDPIKLAKVTALVAELEDLQGSPALATDRALVASIEETSEAYAEQQEATAKANTTIAEREASIDALGFNSLTHGEVKAQHEKAAQSLTEARVALATAKGALDGWERTLRGRKTALDDYDARGKRLKEVEADHLLHERAAARLGDFRVAIAATIRPEMEELMSGFVHLLTDGRHEAVELSEDFEATLYEGGLPIEVVSGGCEDIAALAMRLALSQMIAERAGHPLSLLVLDEPFGSQDENRRGNVLALIRKLSGVFKQVIVISHVAETKDAVDHVIELAFDEGEGCARLVA